MNHINRDSTKEHFFLLSHFYYSAQPSVGFLFLSLYLRMIRLFLTTSSLLAYKFAVSSLPFCLLFILPHNSLFHFSFFFLPSTWSLRSLLFSLFFFPYLFLSFVSFFLMPKSFNFWVTFWRLRPRHLHHIFACMYHLPCVPHVSPISPSFTWSS
jgi:hypothetical protein